MAPGQWESIRTGLSGRLVVRPHREAQIADLRPGRRSPCGHVDGRLRISRSSSKLAPIRAHDRSWCGTLRFASHRGWRGLGWSSGRYGARRGPVPLPAASGNIIRSRRLAVASRRSRPAATPWLPGTPDPPPTPRVVRAAQMLDCVHVAHSVQPFDGLLTDARRAHEPSDHDVPVAPPSYEVARAVAPEHAP